MTYTGSKAITGLGTTLGIGVTPTLVGEIIEVKQSGRTVKTDDTTNMNSLATEFLPTIMDSGTWDITFNRVGTDAGQTALETAFQSLASNTSFTITLPKTSTQTVKGDSWTFLGLVQELSYSIAPDKKVMGTLKVKISGPCNPVAGS